MKRLPRYISFFLDRAIGLLLGLIVIVIFIGVIARYILERPALTGESQQELVSAVVATDAGNDPEITITGIGIAAIYFSCRKS